jgi:hypothetical protein
MNSKIKYPTVKRLLLSFYLPICLIVLCIPAKGQEKPPYPISVTFKVDVTEFLNFGSIIPIGTGGTVTIDKSGARSFSGNIILPPTGQFTSRAHFQVYALPGTLITIVNGTTATLQGSPGHTLNMEVGDSSTGSPFITKPGTPGVPDITDVYIGGTLTVKDIESNPSGQYSGSFQVTFIQQ